jgi:hypothetical protein
MVVPPRTKSFGEKKILGGKKESYERKVDNMCPGVYSYIRGDISLSLCQQGASLLFEYIYQYFQESIIHLLR